MSSVGNSKLWAAKDGETEEETVETAETAAGVPLIPAMSFESGVCSLLGTTLLRGNAKTRSLAV